VTREPASALQGLSGPELGAIAAFWKRERREVPARFGGRSMEPTIRAGDEVLLCCGVPPEVGAVVAFVHGDRVVVHRCVARSRDAAWLLTRGDAHTLPDMPVPAGTVIGAIVERETRSAFAAPRESLERRLVLALCAAALRIGPSLARRVLGALRIAQRLVAAIRGRAPSAV
jgi:hypothetical protein